MSTNPNIHVVEFIDAGGERWRAEQTLGITISGMGEEQQSTVRFINLRTNEILRGRLLTGSAADATEMQAALAEA